MKKLVRLFALAGVSLLLLACGSKKEVVHQSAAFEAAQSLERRAESSYRKGDARGAQQDLSMAANVYLSLAMNGAYAQTQLSLARIGLDAAGTDAKQLGAVRTQLQNVLALPGVSADQQRLANARLAASWLKSGDWASAKPHLDSARTACAFVCSERDALEALQVQWLLVTGAVAQAQRLADALLAKSQTPEANKAGVSQAKLELANAWRQRAQVSAAQKNWQLSLDDSQQAFKLDQEMGASARVIADLELSLQAQEALGQTAAALQTREQLARARTALATLTR